jgi:hypothetical protein
MVVKNETNCLKELMERVKAKNCMDFSGFLRLSDLRRAASMIPKPRQLVAACVPAIHDVSQKVLISNVAFVGPLDRESGSGVRMSVSNSTFARATIMSTIYS